MVTFLYVTGLEALAVAEIVIEADKIMARVPVANMGKASFSRTLFLLILSPIGIVFLNLTPTGDKLVQHLGGSQFLIKWSTSEQLFMRSSSSDLTIR